MLRVSLHSNVWKNAYYYIIRPPSRRAGWALSCEKVSNLFMYHYVCIVCRCNRFWAGDRCIERRITGIGSKRIRSTYRRWTTQTHHQNKSSSVWKRTAKSWPFTRNELHFATILFNAMRCCWVDLTSFFFVRFGAVISIRHRGRPGGIANVQVVGLNPTRGCVCGTLRQRVGPSGSYAGPVARWSEIPNCIVARLVKSPISNAAHPLESVRPYYFVLSNGGWGYFVHGLAYAEYKYELRHCRVNEEQIFPAWQSCVPALAIVICINYD